MSTKVKHIEDFFSEIIKNKIVFSIRDEGGYPVPKNATGKRAMPFWSSRFEVEAVIKTVPDYKLFDIEEVSIDEFINHRLPALKKDKLLIGIDWSGAKATGFDLEASDVLETLKYFMSK